ncbi:MAG: Fe2+-dependent dioxygenase [Chromatiaceae bacterium]|nr:Fe2+-dependent dioxygenase [Gammaproteobacteria bacterium]MCP5319037.1 Fe2+-dependent dioxygenase [Chromatiaceae bacterium]MCP5436369.1 Fe2+-dependent dioxygenase [Chromatiaceae bacterium]MCP5437039.1 Fe2+-dependent dioxygenase [Chromatiaceae bacterium]MCW5587377.1 Fe2+-dependent dioxygenase [Chromatiales bacterium]
MLIEIPELLNSAQLAKIHESIAQARFVDGRLTAGMAASKVKNNEELAQEPELLQRLYRIVMASVGHSEVFRSAVLPAKVADFIFARYQPGMRYGDHVDDPIMGQGPRFRSDVSMTIFLNPPDTYDGGELVIRTPFGDQQVKLPAGHAVVYPSASVHRVAEVSRGERLVALTWIQSFVRDAARRELLYELDQSRQQLLRSDPETDVTKNVDRSYVNLLRMWAEV